MSTKRLVGHIAPRSTPQHMPIPGREDVMSRNAAGGYAFKVDDWQRLHRFLIIGSEGGTYYVDERTLTVDNAEVVRRCIKNDGVRTVQEIERVSVNGLAPKNDPAIIALAMCAKLGNPTTRRAAYMAMPKVCRIGTHLFHFFEVADNLGGWGRGLRNAVKAWYHGDQERVALQVVKYRQRDGWTHVDGIRLSHPKPTPLLNYVVGRGSPDGLPRIVQGYEKIKDVTDPKVAANLITEYRLPRECVPSTLLNNAGVWEALLHDMPMTAMVRNLGKMTRAGLIKPMSDASKLVIARLSDVDQLHRSRIHPLQILLAMKTYAQGSVSDAVAHQRRRHARFEDGTVHTWSPVQHVVSALDDAFYASFKNVTPTGKRHLLAIDTSGSMTPSYGGGVGSLSLFEAAGAMALITANVEKDHVIIGVDTRVHDLRIHPRQRLDDVVKILNLVDHGGTNMSLPYTWASEQRMEFDAVVTYTDSETWQHGYSHPAQACADYRRSLNPKARAVVAAFTASAHSVGDVEDPLTLQCVGFDASLPVVISGFVGGEF